MTGYKLVSTCACVAIMAYLLPACSFAPQYNISNSNMPNSTAQNISSPSVEVRKVEPVAGYSPINGLPQQTPVTTRPLCVMIDNVRIALPQRGLSEADILYEMVTESGITRIMALFEDYTKMPQTGPVRSARDQHVSLMLPMGALLLHVGSSTYASDMLDQFHYNNYSINGFYEDGALKLDAQRNKNIAIENCWFTDAELFGEAAKKYSLGTLGTPECAAFDFAQAPRELIGEAALNVQIRFSGYVTSNLIYNPETHRYEKYQFGKAQIDENNQQCLSFDNVIVLFTEIDKYPDGVLAKVDYSFGGVGYYINGGKYEDIRWQKGNTVNPLIILSPDGKEESVKINGGKTYVAVVDLDKYKYFTLNAQNIEEQGTQIIIPEGEGDIEAKDIK